MKETYLIGKITSKGIVKENHKYKVIDKFLSDGVECRKIMLEGNWEYTFVGNQYKRYFKMYLSNNIKTL